MNHVLTLLGRRPQPKMHELSAAITQFLSSSETPEVSLTPDALTRVTKGLTRKTISDKTIWRSFVGYVARNSDTLPTETALNVLSSASSFGVIDSGLIDAYMKRVTQKASSSEDLERFLQLMNTVGCSDLGRLLSIRNECAARFKSMSASGIVKALQLCVRGSVADHEFFIAVSEALTNRIRSMSVNDTADVLHAYADSQETDHKLFHLLFRQLGRKINRDLSGGLSASRILHAMTRIGYKDELVTNMALFKIHQLISRHHSEFQPLTGYSGPAVESRNSKVYSTSELFQLICNTCKQMSKLRVIESSCVDTIKCFLQDVFLSEKRSADKISIWSLTQLLDSMTLIQIHEPQISTAIVRQILRRIHANTEKIASAETPVDSLAPALIDITSVEIIKDKLSPRELLNLCRGLRTDSGFLIDAVSFFRLTCVCLESTGNFSELDRLWLVRSLILEGQQKFLDALENLEISELQILKKHLEWSFSFRDTLLPIERIPAHTEEVKATLQRYFTTDSGQISFGHIVFAGANMTINDGTLLKLKAPLESIPAPVTNLPVFEKSSQKKKKNAKDLPVDQQQTEANQPPKKTNKSKKLTTDVGNTPTEPKPKKMKKSKSLNVEMENEHSTELSVKPKKRPTYRVARISNFRADNLASACQ